MKKLPSATEILLLSQGSLTGVRFVKPKPGENIFPRLEQDTEDSPGTHIMAVRQLRLPPDTMTPVHRHKSKEKIYIHDGLAEVTVWIHYGGAWASFAMTRAGQQVVVPAWCPHAIHRGKSFPGHFASNIVVITSSQDGKDIEWEEGAENLLKNEHLFVGPPDSD